MGSRRDAERWRLYSWSIEEEKLIPVREGLPPCFVPAPGDERLAWLSPTLVRDPDGRGLMWAQPEQVCVSEPAMAEVESPGTSRSCSAHAADDEGVPHSLPGA